MIMLVLVECHWSGQTVICQTSITWTNLRLFHRYRRICANWFDHSLGWCEACGPDLSLSRSTSWSTVSKPLLKSSLISNALLLSSMAPNMSSSTHVSVVSVLWNFPCENCNSSYKLFLVIWLCSRETTTFFNKLWNIDQIWNRPEIVKNVMV